MPKEDDMPQEQTFAAQPASDGVKVEAGEDTPFE